MQVSQKHSDGPAPQKEEAKRPVPKASVDAPQDESDDSRPSPPGKGSPSKKDDILSARQTEIEKKRKAIADQKVAMLKERAALHMAGKKPVGAADIQLDVDGSEYGSEYDDEDDEKSNKHDKSADSLKKATAKEMAKIAEKSRRDAAGGSKGREESAQRGK